MSAITNNYQRAIYWISTIQSCFRSADRRGHYVLSYPKSGSNWLCNLLSGYLDVRVLEPWNEKYPVFGKRIYHLHRILPFKRLDRGTVYIVRDVRDIVISYFFEMVRSPYSDIMRSDFAEFLGRDVEEGDLVDVLPEFIEFLSGYSKSSIGYASHVRLTKNRKYVFVKFEDLRKNTVEELSRIVEELGYTSLDAERVSAVVEENSIDRQRNVSNAYFIRKGEAGGWREHFSKKAGEKLWEYFGEAMMALGYEHDSSWISNLPTRERLKNSSMNFS